MCVLLPWKSAATEKVLVKWECLFWKKKVAIGQQL